MATAEAPSNPDVLVEELERRLSSLHGSSLRREGPDSIPVGSEHSLAQKRAQLRALDEELTRQQDRISPSPANKNASTSALGTSSFSIRSASEQLSQQDNAGVKALLLDLECNRLKHDLQKQLLRVKELEKAAEHASDAKGLAGERGAKVEKALAALAQSVAMRTKLEETLKAENATRQQAEAHVRALEEHLQAVLRDAEQRELRMLTEQQELAAKAATLERRLREAEASHGDAQRGLEEARVALELARADLAAAEAARGRLQERLAAEAEARQAAEAQTELAAHRLPLQLADPSAQLAEVQRRLLDAELHAQRAQEALEDKQQSVQDLLDRLQKAEARLVDMEAAEAVRLKVTEDLQLGSLALQKSRELRDSLEAALDQEGEAQPPRADSPDLPLQERVYPSASSGSSEGVERTQAAGGEAREAGVTLDDPPPGARRVEWQRIAQHLAELELLLREDGARAAEAERALQWERGERRRLAAELEEAHARLAPTETAASGTARLVDDGAADPPDPAPTPAAPTETPPPPRSSSVAAAALATTAVMESAAAHHTRLQLEAALKAENRARREAEDRIRALEERLALDRAEGAGQLRTAGEDERRLAEATAAVLLLQREAAAHRAELELKAGEAALLQRQLLDVTAKLSSAEEQVRALEASAQPKTISRLGAFDPTRPLERLTVTVSHGVTLAWATKTCDPFVSVRMGLHSYQTGIKVGAADPAWHESFTFDAPKGPLEVHLRNGELDPHEDTIGHAEIPLDKELLLELQVGQSRQWVPVTGPGAPDESGVLLVLEGSFGSSIGNTTKRGPSSNTVTTRDSLEDKCRELQLQVDELETKLRDQEVEHLRVQAQIREEAEAKLREALPGEALPAGELSFDRMGSSTRAMQRNPSGEAVLCRSLQLQVKSLESKMREMRAIEQQLTRQLREQRVAEQELVARLRAQNQPPKDERWCG